MFFLGVQVRDDSSGSYSQNPATCPHEHLTLLYNASSGLVTIPKTIQLHKLNQLVNMLQPNLFQILEFSPVSPQLQPVSSRMHAGLESRPPNGPWTRGETGNPPSQRATLGFRRWKVLTPSKHHCTHLVTGVRLSPPLTRRGLACFGGVSVGSSEKQHARKHVSLPTTKQSVLKDSLRAR